MDVTDLIDYNLGLLNGYDLTTCFFHLDRDDPTVGFNFDASRPMGNTFPKATACPPFPVVSGGVSLAYHQYAYTSLRLILGSCLAWHLRHQLEEQKGYTATAGVSTNKLLSKLVGNLNKPHDQTTLISTSSCDGEECENNVLPFLDSHEIGKLPGIGSRIARKIRGYMIERPLTHDAGFIVDDTAKNEVSIQDVRLNPDMGPALLENLIGGTGVQKNIGHKIWGLMHGVDDSEVLRARDLPRQISIVSSGQDCLGTLLTYGVGG